MRSPNIPYWSGLDHLRGFAATLIVFYHGLHVFSFAPRAHDGDLYSLWIRTLNPLLALVEEGHTAVGFFIMLSGFLFSISASGKQVSPGAFLRNRLLRIAPLFSFVLVVGAVAYPSEYSFLAVLQTVLLQADFPGGFKAGPFTGMFWAVAVEFQLYLLFPYLHLFVERYGVRWALSCISLCLLMRLGASAIGTSNPRDISYWHVLGRIDQFLIGMLAARLFPRVQALTWPRGGMLALSAAVVLTTLVAFNQAGGYPNTGLWKVIWPTLEALVWAQLLMAYALYSDRLPAWLSRPLAALGTISYSTYLLHYACITVVSRAPLPKLPWGSEITALVYVVCFVLPLLIPLAALSYYVIERPFLALRVRYLS